MRPKKSKPTPRSASGEKTAAPSHAQKNPAPLLSQDVDLYAELIEKVPVGIMVLRLEDHDDPKSLRLIALNKSASRITRLSPHEYIGQRLYDFSPDVFQTELPQRYLEVMRTGVPHNIEDLRYGNARMPDANYRVHIFSVAEQCIAISFEDITARRQAEEMVRQMIEVLSPAIGENYLRALVSHLAQACHADLVLVGRIHVANADQIQTIALWRDGQLRENMSYDFKGTPSEQVLMQTFGHFESQCLQKFPTDTLLAQLGFDACMGMALQSSQGKTIGLISLLNRSPLPHPDQAETLLRIVAARAAAELDRQLSEEALRASEEFLRMSQRAGNVGSWQWDLRTNSVHWSDSMYALYGIPLGDFDGTLTGATRTTHPDDIPLMTDAITKTISEGLGRAFEYRVTRADGEIAYLWSQSDVICDANGKQTHVIGTVIDLSARKKLDAQIRQAQKLESLGVLAGGIAHDFNNILTSLLGYADLALQELPAHSTARPLVSEAVKAARRAAELTKQMLAYSGRGRFAVDAINLNDVIEDMASLLQVSISKKCSLTYHFMPDLPAVEADVVQVRQIIMNLIINAAEAIGDRNGVIDLTTGVMHCDHEYLSAGYLNDNLPAGDYVFVEVSDSGCGMSEATLARIFDPFFTTKFTGRGLGLAAVHGIVRGHRGIVTVKSDVNKGTLFKIVLPASKTKASLPDAAVNRKETLQGAGIVLVVDDEEAIRELATRMLERMGFKVMLACDGREAVELFRTNANDIRLVLLDMTMPNLDGEETFDALRAIRPDVRAILSSGYDEQSATRRFVGKGLAGFLQKPYTYEQLLNACKHGLHDDTSNASDRPS